jgi:predicted PurR-regulated permease PerM
MIGPLGALLAIPLSLLLKALLIDIDPTTQWINGSSAAPGRHDPAPHPRWKSPPS